MHSRRVTVCRARVCTRSGINSAANRLLHSLHTHVCMRVYKKRLPTFRPIREMRVCTVWGVQQGDPSATEIRRGSRTLWAHWAHHEPMTACLILGPLTPDVSGSLPGIAEPVGGCP